MYRLMLVEDEMDILNGLASHIPWEDYGFQVVGQACNGAEALLMKNEVNPDVIMSDIRMPGTDGLFMLETLRKNNDDVRVVILSGYDDFEYARKAMYHDADAYLLKPTNEDEIREVFLKLRNELDQKKESVSHIREARNALFFSGIARSNLTKSSKYSVSSTFAGTEKELKIMIFEAVLNADSERVTSRLREYLRLLALHIDDSSMVYLKVDELISQLAVELSQNGIELKDFCDDVVLYHKISENHTFVELSEWLQSFLGKVCGLVKNMRRVLRDPLLRTILDYIDSHIDAKLTLAELAGIAYMSEAYFSRYFKHGTGRTVTDYISDIRIEKAKKHLRDTNLKVYQISEMVGYDDFRYFSKIFKAKEGVSPKDFQKGLK